MSGSRLVKGTMILSAAMFISKMLGLVFVIPFNALVGINGGTLYGYAYTPYTILLSIATLGVPLAVSKFVSKYNALGDYHTGRRLFYSGLVLMTITGVLAFLVLYFIAPFISPFVIQKDTSGITRADVTLVIRVVSTALIIIPAMSLIRGYFQGFESMGPTASSQLIEQVIRVGFILIGAFFVRSIIHGSVTTAVAVATFGAFVGGLGGLIVLIRYWIKRKRFLDKMLDESSVDYQIPLPMMYKELITYAVPFVAVGLSQSLYQLVDQFTISHYLILYHHYSQQQANNVFANINFYVQKLLMIPVSLSMSIALAVVPAITRSFAEGRTEGLHKNINQSLQLVLFLTIPSSIGLSFLGYMLYGMLYPGMDHSLVILGGKILQLYAPTAILFALFSITAALLQGINKQKITVLSLGVGLLLKMVLTPVCILWFPISGAIIATNIGFAVSIIINLGTIRSATGYQFTFIFKRFVLISLFTGIMILPIQIVFWIHGGEAPYSFTQAVFYSIVGIVLGVIVFGYLVLRSGLASKILGDRFSFIKRKQA